VKKEPKKKSVGERQREVAVIGVAIPGDGDSWSCHYKDLPLAPRASQLRPQTPVEMLPILDLPMPHG
jgi:hypothetical protein